MAYNLPRVLPHVKAIADSVGPRFGITTIYGWRPVDPYIGHPQGRALDFMSNSAATRAALANYLKDNTGADQVIYDRLIWTIEKASQGWRPYDGIPHNDHVHGRWPASGTATNLGFNPLGAIPGLSGLASAEKLASLFANPGTWVRVSMFVGGILFVAIGVLGASRATQIAKGVIK